MQGIFLTFMVILGCSYIGILLSSPIGSLFFLLAFIVCSGAVLISMGLSYLGFLLISIYGGAIVVLFLLVSMLLNKKSLVKKRNKPF